MKQDKANAGHNAATECHVEQDSVPRRPRRRKRCQSQTSMHNQTEHQPTTTRPKFANDESRFAEALATEPLRHGIQPFGKCKKNTLQNTREHISAAVPRRRDRRAWSGPRGHPGPPGPKGVCHKALQLLQRRRPMHNSPDPKGTGVRLEGGRGWVRPVSLARLGFWGLAYIREAVGHQYRQRD